MEDHKRDQQHYHHHTQHSLQYTRPPRTFTEHVFNTLSHLEHGIDWNRGSLAATTITTTPSTASPNMWPPETRRQHEFDTFFNFSRNQQAREVRIQAGRSQIATPEGRNGRGRTERSSNPPHKAAVIHYLIQSFAMSSTQACLLRHFPSP